MDFKTEVECWVISPPIQPNRILSCAYIYFGYLIDLSSSICVQDSKSAVIRAKSEGRYITDFFRGVIFSGMEDIGALKTSDSENRGFLARLQVLSSHHDSQNLAVIFI